jgi:predicted DNA-binding transcriptional regulator AlpA
MRQRRSVLPVPHTLSLDPSYEPFLRLTDGLLLRTEEVAKHLRYGVQSLHNMRRARTGPAWVKLPGGAIRYRHSEILAYELYGHGGGLTLDRVAVALATCPDLKPAQREKIEAHLKRVLCERV